MFLAVWSRLGPNIRVNYGRRAIPTLFGSQYPGKLWGYSEFHLCRLSNPTSRMAETEIHTGWERSNPGVPFLASSSFQPEEWFVVAHPPLRADKRLSAGIWERDGRQQLNIGCCFDNCTTDLEKHPSGRRVQWSVTALIPKRLTWPVNLHRTSQPQFPLWLADWLCKRINTSRSRSNLHRHPVHYRAFLTMPDGIYKIRNTLCSEYVELDGDNPLGPICARKDGTGGGNEVRVVLCTGLYSPVQ